MGGRRPSHGVWLALTGTSPSSKGRLWRLLRIAQQPSQKERVTRGGATPTST